MSKLLDAIKYKRKIKNEQSREHKERMNQVISSAVNKKKLIEYFESHVDPKFNNGDDCVTVIVDEKAMSEFTRIIHTDRFSDYDIVSVDDDSVGESKYVFNIYMKQIYL